MKAWKVAVALIGLQVSHSAFAEHPLDDSLAFERMIPFLMDSPVEIKAAADHFNETLRSTKTEGTISACGPVIRLTLGGYRNTSYGAICTYHKDQQISHVFICDDEMVGHLFITPDYTDTDQWQVNAIGQNCVGG